MVRLNLDGPLDPRLLFQVVGRAKNQVVSGAEKLDRPGDFSTPAAAVHVVKAVP